MASSRDTASTWLDSSHATKVSWKTNAPGAVTPNIKWRSPCRHYGGGTTAATSRCSGHIVGVVGSPVDQVVGFERKRKLRRVRLADQWRPFQE
jgi:hypothetical protein